MFADKAATWEVNPQWDPGHPFFKDYPWVVIEDLNVRVPEIYARHFRRDPVDAQTKYMAQPPPQQDGFFEIPLKLTQAVNRDLPPAVVTKGTSIRHQTLANGDLREMPFVRLDVASLPLPVPEAKYYMHGDPGLVNDAFAVCVCHDVPGEFIWVVDDEGEQTKAKKIVVDFVLAWEPRPNTPVDLINVQDVMLLLAQTYGIRRVTFDRWNSATSIQWLIERGVYAEDLNFSLPQQLQMYRNLKMLVYNSMLELPDDAELLNELLFLRLEGNRLTHNAYGKDRADAVAAAVWEATGRRRSAVEELVAQTLGEYVPGAAPGNSYVIVSQTLGRVSHVQAIDSTASARSSGSSPRPRTTTSPRVTRVASLFIEIRPTALPQKAGNGSLWSFSEPCCPTGVRHHMISRC
jgi:hypothetical protein